MKQQAQFIRIAMARIKKQYPFYPQRLAMAANMYRHWLDRKIAP
jgi:hypothetical protein